MTRIDAASSRPIPEWFRFSQALTAQIMSRMGEATSAVTMIDQVRFAPMQALWFVGNSLSLANEANREGMHANALSLTRQCVEAIGIIELGVCGHPEAEAKLLLWEQDNLSPGNLRRWLEGAVWPGYGTGLWTEPWSTFMGQFAGAVQSYAHYTRDLAQWQSGLRRVHDANQTDKPFLAMLELGPRVYDAQKATRITLFHALLTYLLGRIWLAAHPTDTSFAELMARFGKALSCSRYLDGHQTNWSQQFWAMVWMQDGQTDLE